MLGQRILEQYKENYHFVVPSASPYHEELLKHENIQYVPSDYTMASYLSAFEHCDAVIHSGARVPRKTSEASGLVAYIPNLSSTEAVFEACARLGISNVVNFSSVAVYEERSYGPLLRESDTLCPPAVYTVW